MLTLHRPAPVGEGDVSGVGAYRRSGAPRPAWIPAFIVVAALLFAPAASGAPADEGNEPAASNSWTCSASMYLYLVPDDRDYLQPTVSADNRRLHLEARYNYENFETVSLWVGYNFAFGETVSFAFTPMLGLVLGETTGAAPGGHVSVSWKVLEFYSEGEHVIDFDDASNSFFYSWSQLMVSLTSWLQAGYVAQRTQVYETPREFQGGPSLGVAIGGVEVTGDMFNPDLPHPTYVVSVSIDLRDDSSIATPLHYRRRLVAPRNTR